MEATASNLDNNATQRNLLLSAAPQSRSSIRKLRFRRSGSGWAGSASPSSSSMQKANTSSWKHITHHMLSYELPNINCHQHVLRQWSITGGRRRHRLWRMKKLLLRSWFLVVRPMSLADSSNPCLIVAPAYAAISDLRPMSLADSTSTSC